ncbi:alpha/beta fold hydrolase [Gluconobacter japonicus]|uniref:2-hydroxy-6-oxohepta-2,4-dienoate hydrolase n=1 Tax=Gluconobacter japonicus TaxID=376620 RepID=A0ABQ5WMH5_GLUJA|nr:alpha/beta hydrolase [Gluconobacter japonicus]KXV25833.1 2-hydroxy-6-oxo-2-4-heptadienoate hydrolase [Gluconobacter japonicus]GLQ61057.1 2-hydroxy-6-oxohepta-2,4-dienoate hydrolase [Gluconobacter japonicus]
MRRLLRASMFAIALAGIGICPASEAQALPPLKSISVYGQKIRFLEAGTGPDLVLVHGLGSSATMDWGKVIPGLAQHYHVIAMDQLGFGSSEKPLIAYGIQTWVDMLDGFLKAKHITHFMLAGESLGGWIAGLYVVEAAQDSSMAMPSRLVLSDAAGHRSLVEHGLPLFGPVSFFGIRTGLRSLFYNKALITDDLVKAIFQTRMAEGAQYTQESFARNANAPDTFLDNRMTAIQIPTLVIWGQDDQVIPLSDGQDFAAHIPNAHLVIIPHSGHAPSIERPEEFLNAVTPFLASH